jgi:hypothetical protein
MSLTVNNFNRYNAIATSNDLVSSSELESISRELFAAAPSAQPASSVSFGQNVSKLNKFDSNNGLKLFGAEAQLSTQNLEQVAVNKAGYNVNLSNNALTSIASLNAQAAKLQFNAPKQMDGKVFVPEIKADADVKSVFAASNSLQSVEIGEMNKDRRGSNPFFVPAQKETQDNNQESLNIFA